LVEDNAKEEGELALGLTEKGAAGWAMAMTRHDANAEAVIAASSGRSPSSSASWSSAR